MHRKSYKYRLYPNKEQEQKLIWTLDRCRELYNAALDERRSVAPRFYAYQVYGNAIAVQVDEIEPRSKNIPVQKQAGLEESNVGNDVEASQGALHYGNVATVEVDEIEKYPKSAPPEKQRGLVKARSKSRAMRSVTKYSQSRELTEIKHEVRPEYQEINDHILRNVLDRVDKAFDAFFRRCKAGQTPGYPRFQGRNRYDSLTTDCGFKLKVEERGNKKLKGTLHLSGVGDIRVKLHRKVEGKIKTCTVKREGEHWYVTLSCEIPEPEKLPVSPEVVGIDLGITHFAALSDGSFIDNPQHYRKAEKVLQRRQQILSRKKRGSNRRKKAVRLVAKAHRKIRNQRRDYLHKASRKLVNKHQVIVFEDLQAANLVKRPKPKQDEDGTYVPNGASAKAGLNKSISDAGWSMFVAMCSYKAECAGRTVLQVNPKNTSQICSGCKREGPHKDLSERTHVCVHCGLVLDRDTNAAINILRLGHIEGLSDSPSTHDPSQTTIEAGSASASVLASPPQREKPERAAEYLSDHSSLSQASLWDGS